jgi:hypothetical protein
MRLVKFGNLYVNPKRVLTVRADNIKSNVSIIKMNDSSEVSILCAVDRTAEAINKGLKDGK